MDTETDEKGGYTGRVLVVDDDEDVQLLCRMNLEVLGFDVSGTVTSRDLLAVAREEDPR